MRTENLGAEELHRENYSPRTADTSDQVLVSVLYRFTGFFFPPVAYTEFLQASTMGMCNIAYY